MSTVIRRELSQKNNYRIDKQIRYELEHFCLQYKMWKKEVHSFEEKYGKEILLQEECAEELIDIKRRYDYYKRSIAMVESAAAKTDDAIGPYIFKAVTEELYWPALKTLYDIPCSRGTFYNRLHKFFYILDDMRL